MNKSILILILGFILITAGYYIYTQGPITASSPVKVVTETKVLANKTETITTTVTQPEVQTQ
ncbi:MAG: hypothetical protein QW721_01975, partial [Desulfurococcaceae archaeon]